MSLEGLGSGRQGLKGKKTVALVQAHSERAIRRLSDAGTPSRWSQVSVEGRKSGPRGCVIWGSTGQEAR
jgi:hypothetical protein